MIGPGSKKLGQQRLAKVAALLTLHIKNLNHHIHKSEFCELFGLKISYLLKPPLSVEWRNQTGLRQKHLSLHRTMVYSSLQIKEMQMVRRNNHYNYTYSNGAHLHSPMVTGHRKRSGTGQHQPVTVGYRSAPASNGQAPVRSGPASNGQTPRILVINAVNSPLRMSAAGRSRDAVEAGVTGRQPRVTGRWL